MSQLQSLLDEVGGAMDRRPEPARARTLARIADQFCREAERLPGEAVEVYDGVMQRVVVSVAAPGRAELADRLAAVSNGPRGVLRTLALDEEIAVARPVLTRATSLEDQDLIEVASRKGAAHQLAICERTRVSEAVTDVLVTRGDGPVKQAIASNGGARFSPVGTATLLDASRENEQLQDALGSRRDLPPHVTRQLVAIAEQHVRRRLIDTLPRVSAGVATFNMPSSRKRPGRD